MPSPAVSALPLKVRLTVLATLSTVTAVTLTPLPLICMSKALVGGGLPASSATSKDIVKNCSLI